MHFNSKLVIPGVIGALVILAFLGGGYFYYQSLAQVKGADEVKKLVLEVGKLIDLPTGEDPTVATVTDISKLKDQPFFQKAKNGDKVLIYTQAKKAILYDPKIKKVIDVAPLNIGTQSAQARLPDGQVAQPKIVLRNGTQTIGLTTKVEAELKKTFPNLNVSEKENAAKADYQNTMIVVLNEAGKDLANSLVNTLKGSSLSTLPAEETKPKDADILIILGQDRT